MFFQNAPNGIRALFQLKVLKVKAGDLLHSVQCLFFTTVPPRSLSVEEERCLSTERTFTHRQIFTRALSLSANDPPALIVSFKCQVIARFFFFPPTPLFLLLFTLGAIVLADPAVVLVLNRRTPQRARSFTTPQSPSANFFGASFLPSLSFQVWKHNYRPHLNVLLPSAPPRLEVMLFIEKKV